MVFISSLNSFTIEEEWEELPAQRLPFGNRWNAFKQWFITRRKSAIKENIEDNGPAWEGRAIFK
jgi:hypothetical protein